MSAELIELRSGKRLRHNSRRANRAPRPKRPQSVSSAVWFALLHLDIARGACESERRGSRQRIQGHIDSAIKELRRAVDPETAAQKLGQDLHFALGQGLTCGEFNAVRHTLSLILNGLEWQPKADDDGAA